MSSLHTRAASLASSAGLQTHLSLIRAIHVVDTFLPPHCNVPIVDPGGRYLERLKHAISVDHRRLYE